MCCLKSVYFCFFASAFAFRSALCKSGRGLYCIVILLHCCSVVVCVVECECVGMFVCFCPFVRLFVSLLVCFFLSFGVFCRVSVCFFSIFRFFRFFVFCGVLWSVARVAQGIGRGGYRV